MTGRAHLLLVLLTVGLVGFVLHLVRAGRLRAKYAMLWSTVGAGLVVLAAFPGLLDWMAEHIAASMTLEPADFDYEPFAQEGGLLGAQEAFGDALDQLLKNLSGDGGPAPGQGVAGGLGERDPERFPLGDDARG